MKNMNELNQDMIARIKQQHEQSKASQIDQLHTMYAQKMSVMTDQHDQAILKQQKDMLRDLVHHAKGMLEELCNSVLAVGDDLRSGWYEMVEQALEQKNKGKIEQTSAQQEEVFDTLYKILLPQIEDVLLEKDQLREEIMELKTQVGDLKSKISKIHKENEQNVREMQAKMEKSGRMSES